MSAAWAEELATAEGRSSPCLVQSAWHCVCVNPTSSPRACRTYSNSEAYVEADISVGLGRGVFFPIDKLLHLNLVSPHEARALYIRSIVGNIEKLVAMEAFEVEGEGNIPASRVRRFPWTSLVQPTFGLLL